MPMHWDVEAEEEGSAENLLHTSVDPEEADIRQLTEEDGMKAAVDHTESN